MSFLRYLSCFIGLVVATSSLAKTVDQDFKMCAQAALQERDQSAKNVLVDINGMSRRQLDHDWSLHKSTFKMLVSDKSSGADLGEVTCIVSKSGQLISASFNRN